MIGCHCGADNQRTETAKGQEELGKRLVFEDELQRSAIDEDAILLILVEEVRQIAKVVNIVVPCRAGCCFLRVASLFEFGSGATEPPAHI